jgi:hypothetical protein
MVFKSRPVDEADYGVSLADTYTGSCHRCIPMTPFPMPLMTPPDTKTYFMLAVLKVGQMREGAAQDSSRTASKLIERHGEMIVTRGSAVKRTKTNV